MRTPPLAALLASLALTAPAVAQPSYQIYDIGVVQTGDSASQGLRASPGGIAVGRSLRSGASQAFAWTAAGGLVALPNLAGRNFCVANSANDNGIVVGSGATTAFGSGRLPVIWNNGVVSQLPLPSGQTTGDANSVNASGVAVGSINGGSLQRGVIYSGGTATVISQTTPNGSFFTTAFGNNDAGRVVGQGIDPNNAAVNVGIVYDTATNTAFSVGALPDFNGALAFGVSNAGHVVGTSMLNQGSGLPFIWTDAGGMVAIPLPTGTSQGSARAVNSAGWAVGTASSAFAIPFLYDGTTTYRLADIIPAGSGWDLSTNTSSSALGISDNGVIVGTGVRNGATRAYAMVPTLQLASAVSRRLHATGGVVAGTFDIVLPLTGAPGVECRSGGSGGKYTFVVTFTNPVTSGNATVTDGTGTLSSAPSFSGHTMSINLAGVADLQTITVTLQNVTDSFGQALPSAEVRARILIGDVNGNNTVNASDIGQVKGQAGTPASNANFRTDLDANGSVTASDIGQVKANAGNTLP
jgi:probable HAF family extracellular repeat protein